MIQRLLFVSALVALSSGCSSGRYYFSFALTDPGARNASELGERNVLEDGDVKAEILADAVSFRAIAYEVRNKTNAPISVAWDNIILVGPDGTQTSIRPASPPPPEIVPNAKAFVILMPFNLPSHGSEAAAYNGASFQLVVPMVVRGTLREYRYHLIAHTLSY